MQLSSGDRSAEDDHQMNACSGRGLLELGVPKKRIAELFKISRTTLYRYLGRLGVEK